MNENRKIIAKGNEAVCWGAVSADCHHFFGYPVTPQNEITEWFAAEYPKRGWSFVQGESEWSVTGMLFGASAAGARVITSTAGPGWGLMQEILSSIAAARLPVVIVVVQRGGPGQGTTSHAQMDYAVATRGGHGGWKNIVLGPSSVQENCDLVQMGFYLADKYRNPVVVLTDAIIGQMVEKLEVRKLDFGPLPAKDWAMAGHAVKGERYDMIASGPGMIGSYVDTLRATKDSWDKIAKEEVRWEDYKTEDADVVLVAYGYPSRACMEAVDWARADGFKLGLLRPITLWPFPYDAVKKHSDRGAKLLVVEDSLGQLIEDVRLAVGADRPVSQVTVLDRHNPTFSGMIMPDVVLEKARKLL
ncbi:MAG: transketolase C-terminal domain-containing protein [Dehalococcoidia bacterium]|nr:transketolase C-terminal domain-containing protein [Dehalococcoidia bacterium]